MPTVSTDTRAVNSAQRSLLQQAGWFLAAFILLQTVWTISLNSKADDVLVGTLTVKVSAAIIQVLTPSANAFADGRKINAVGGGIHIGDGCEGVSVLFLLIAAIVASSASWRRKFAGLALGFVLVYLLNQIRIVGLFYAYRADRSLFELLHHIVAPIAMIIAVGFFYLVWAMRSTR